MKKKKRFEKSEKFWENRYELICFFAYSKDQFYCNKIFKINVNAMGVLLYERFLKLKFVYITLSFHLGGYVK